MKTLAGNVASVVCAAWALLLGASADAHHSNAQFDVGNCVNIAGTVRSMEWVYPHSWLWVVVPGADGSDAVWGFEFPSPSQTLNLDKRWTKTLLKKGDKIVVNYSPLKDGRHGGWMHAVTLPDGSVLPGAPGPCERSVPIPAK